MDREGDAFELLAGLIEKERRFVIRASHDLMKSEKKRTLPANPTIADVWFGIACLGGHLARNGPPG